MRAAHIENGVVTNYCEVAGIDGIQYLDPAGSVIGSVWSGGMFHAPAPPTPVVPESVPMLNLQLVLISDGKLNAVETILSGLTGDDGLRALAYWHKAQTARRDNYLVTALAPMIGYDDESLDGAFVRAAALNP